MIIIETRISEKGLRETHEDVTAFLRDPRTQNRSYVVLRTILSQLSNQRLLREARARKEAARNLPTIREKRSQ